MWQAEREWKHSEAKRFLMQRKSLEIFFIFIWFKLDTSFQMHRWLQIRMYTISDTVFWHNILCPFTYVVICFVRSVSPRNHFANQKHLLNWFSNTSSRTDRAMWKCMKNLARKWCQKLCTFLFEVTYVWKDVWRKCFFSLMEEITL